MLNCTIAVSNSDSYYCELRRNDDGVKLDEKPNKSVLATMQTSLGSKLPPNMIIASANLRLGELIGQGITTFFIQ